MTRRTTRKPTPEDRLALLLRDSLIEVWVAHNPTHDNPEFEAVKHMGRAGYTHVARALLRRGVRLPMPPASRGDSPCLT